MEQGIKYVITGDTSGLVSAEKQAENALDKLNKKISSLQSEIAQNIKISQGYEKAISDLTKEYKAGSVGSAQYAKSLDRLQRDEKETQVETQRLRKELALLRADQKNLAGAYPSLSKNINTYNKSQRNASAGAVEFGRLLGDLPYGIQGVANNIQQLAFVMGGSAGIQIGIALVTGALVAFGDELFKSTSATEKQKKELEELRKTLEDYKDSLRGVSAARLEGQRDAVEELTTLKLLKNQLDDTKLSQEERLEAYSELQRLYPSYFGNISKEQSLAGALETQYKTLTAALLEKAKAQAAADLITENKREQLLIDGKILELDQKIAKAEEARAKAVEKRDLDFNAFTASQVVQANREITQLEEEQNKLVERNNSLLEDNLRLVEEVGNQGGIVPFDFGEEEVGKSAREGIEKAIKLEPLDLSGLKFSGMDKLAEQAAYIFSTQFGEKVKASDLTGDISITGELLTDTSQLPTQGIDEYVAKMQQAQKTAEIASNGISAGFNAATQSIVKDLETGSAVFDAFISSVAGGLVDLLSQFVQFQLEKAILAKKDIAIDQTKATSKAIVAGSETAAASGPFAAFVLPALIAGAVAVIAGAFGGLKFAQGGMIGGGSFTGDKVPILANSGEYVLTAQDQGYLTNFLRGNSRGTQNTGGAITVTGRIEAEGSKLVTVINKATRSNNRRGGNLNVR